MPSPFPGMDPYLEHPEYFPELHAKLIVHLQETLNTLLPEPYFAKHNQRVWIEYSDRYIEPDLHVFQEPGSRLPTGERTSEGGIATAEPARYVIVRNEAIAERSEPFVEVYRRVDSKKQLVTCIEILSIANKSPDDHGQALYWRKQQDMLNSRVHFLEIDLLRGGVHTTAVSHGSLLRQCGKIDYHYCVHRYNEPGDFQVYPILLTNRLPRLDLPLAPGDAPIQVDMQQLFDRCYDLGAYERQVDYTREEIRPPLTAEQQAWANDLLKVRAESM